MLILQLALIHAVQASPAQWQPMPPDSCQVASESCTCTETDGTKECFQAFWGEAAPIPDTVWSEMAGVSWKEGCPLGRAELRLLRITHWNKEQQPTLGEMVVSAKHADTVLAAFEDIYNARFTIERMVRVDAYGASDRKSMQANNTSAFNCRPVSGTSTWSQHSYGGAIDINPFWNPWVKGTRVDPKEAVDFVDRSNVRPGMISDGDAVVNAFTSRGWGWGGHWHSLKDYQHISANGK